MPSENPWEHGHPHGTRALEMDRNRLVKKGRMDRSWLKQTDKLRVDGSRGGEGETQVSSLEDRVEERLSTAEHEQGEDFIQKKIGFQHVHAVGSKEYLNRLEYQEGDLQASMAW